MGADSLPAEIWIQVFAATRQWNKVSKFTTLPLYSTFTAIASTCSRFHDIVLPLLYEHAIIRSDVGLDPKIQLVALPKQLNANPECRKWIKSLAGYCTASKIQRGYDDASPRGKLVCTIIQSMIPFLSSLESIHLDYPQISKELLTVIYNCPTLRTLSIHDPKFESGLIVPLGRLSKELERKSSLLHLRVTASFPTGLDGSPLFFLRIPNLRRIVYTEYSFMAIPVSILFRRGLDLPWSELRELKLSAMMELSGIGNLSALCKVLAHAANLESLVFDAMMWDMQGLSGSGPPPPASTVMPKLKEFYGPADIAPALCEGKAIEKLGLIFHIQPGDEKLEDLSSLDRLAGTLLHLTLGNMETDKVSELIKAYPLLQSLEILPSMTECQKDTVSAESDYIGQPRQEERSQLEHWVEDYLAPLMSGVPHLTRLVIRPFEGPGAIVARRGLACSVDRSRSDPPDPGPAPDPAEPCIDEQAVLGKLLVPCPGLKDVVFPSLHRWTRYHPTYGWELVERQCGKYDTEDYPLPVSREDLKPW
ncbi:hypothetical protein FRC01_010183 [Tulasnella sp. 417]|nr:hypothetical protein FRC01_010183 [Tulasnella sp. 417]